MIYQSIVVVMLVTMTQGAKLQSYFTKCKKSDPNINQCIVQNANMSMRQFVEGDSSVHLQSMNPLKVPQVFVEVNNRLYMNISDMVLTGLEQSEFEVAKVDFEKKKFEFLFRPPYINVKSQYTIHGRILILPITGTGPLNVTFVQPRVNYSFEYDLHQQGKHEYMVLKNVRLIYTVLDRAYFQLDNLFNGDPTLGAEMSRFLNENWREVNEEVGFKLGEAIGEIVSTILGNFFAKIPFSELFDD